MMWMDFFFDDRKARAMGIRADDLYDAFGKACEEEGLEKFEKGQYGGESSETVFLTFNRLFYAFPELPYFFSCIQEWVWCIEDDCGKMHNIDCLSIYASLLEERKGILYGGVKRGKRYS